MMVMMLDDAMDIVVVVAVHLDSRIICKFLHLIMLMITIIIAVVVVVVRLLMLDR